MPSSRNDKEKGKSLFKKVVGDWDDLKAGTKKGAALRDKPFQWIERQAAKMDAAKAQARLQKFQSRAKIVLVVILVAWVLAAVFALHVKALAVVISSVLVFLLWWVMYRNVVKSAKRRMPKK